MFKKFLKFLFPNISVEKIEIAEPEPWPKKYHYRIVEVLPGEYRVEWSTYCEPDWWVQMPLPITFRDIARAEEFIEKQRIKDAFEPKVIKTYE